MFFCGFRFYFYFILSVCELNLQLIPCCSYVLLMFVPCDSNRHNTNILIINWQEVVLSQVFLNLQNKQCSTHFGAEVFWWMLFVFWNMMVLMNAPSHIKICRIARCCVFVFMGTLLCVCVFVSNVYILGVCVQGWCVTGCLRGCYLCTCVCDGDVCILYICESDMDVCCAVLCYECVYEYFVMVLSVYLYMW